MRIPRWVSEKTQAIHSAENEKGKWEIKVPDNRLVTDIVTGCLCRIASDWGPVMPDHDRRIGISAEAFK